MLKILKKINLLLASITLILPIALPISAYADRVDYWEMMEMQQENEAVEFTVSAEVPDEFYQKVEVRFDTAGVILYYDETAENTGYTRVGALWPGTYKVNVILPDDIGDFYTAEVPETFDVAPGARLDLKIIRVKEEDDPNEEHYHDDFNPDEHDSVDVEPAYYDFSDGSEDTVSLHIQSGNYPAIWSVVYRLRGENQVYEIKLDKDHLMSADVLLPKGSYTESGQGMNVELSPSVITGDSLQFIWGHKDGSFFGKTYQFDEDTAIDDLILIMSYMGDTAEVDSNLLFRAKQAQNLQEARAEHYEKKIDEKLSEFEPEEHETQAAEPEAENQSIGAVMIVVIALILIALMIGAVYLKRCIDRSRGQNE